MMRWKRFFSHWENWCGLLLLLLFLLGAIAAPVISPVDEKNPGPFKQVGKPGDFVPHPPNKMAILGTLPGQYDVFHTLVWGTRDAMKFGLLVVVSSFLIGVFFGSVAGYAGGGVNGFMMRVADAFLTFPPIAGVVFLQQLIGITITGLGGTYYFNFQLYGRLIFFEGAPTPLMIFLSRVDPLMVSLILVSWVPYARLVNSVVLALKQTDFIQAARALGGSPFWVIRRHILPNSIGPVIVLGARDVGSVVILQATITFIGLGGASPWGTLLSMGRNWVLGPRGNLLASWWVYLPVTLAVILFGVMWNLIGDGLNDVLIPTSQGVLTGRSSRGKQKKEADALSMEREFLLFGSRAGRPLAPAYERQTARAMPSKKTSEYDDVDPVLIIAREFTARGDVPRALHAYAHMIRRKRMLDESLKDLARLAKDHPRDSRVWQILGDALALVGHADYAAQSYAQARKFLQ